MDFVIGACAYKKCLSGFDQVKKLIILRFCTGTQSQHYARYLHIQYAIGGKDYITCVSK